MNPNLIENESRYLLRASLAEMHKQRIEWYYVLLNAGIGLFIAGVIAWLWFMHRAPKPSKAEREAAARAESQRILAKINEVRAEKAREDAVAQQETLITELPVFETMHNYATNKV